MFGVKLATVSATATQNSYKVLCDVKINGIKASSLMDTGSSDCYMDKRFAVKHSLRITETNNEVTLTETSVRMPIHVQCLAKSTVTENEYSDVTFNVLNNLATDVIIGETIFKKHDKVVFSFDGYRTLSSAVQLPY